MASANQRDTSDILNLDAAAERARDAGHRLARAGRQATSAYLDGIDRYATGVARAERALGEQSRLAPVSQTFDAHAKLTEDVVKAGVAATRELVGM